jgi:hypothetical protein
MENNNDELLLVLDIDETLLHYTDEPLPYNPDFTPVFEKEDQLFLRPGLQKFLDFVKSTNGKVKLGIWTFGNRRYAKGLLPILNFCVENDSTENKWKSSEKSLKKPCLANLQFLYTIENMKPEMEPKELSYVLEEYLGQEYDRHEGLPPNIFLVDNRPENVYHDINIRNSIMVESYTGKNKSDNMFMHLIDFCKKFLDYGGKVPKKFLQNFMVDGEMKTIISIGKHFDNGMKPINIHKNKWQQVTTIRKGTRTIRKGGSKKTRKKKS